MAINQALLLDHLFLPKLMITGTAFELICTSKSEKNSGTPLQTLSIVKRFTLTQIQHENFLCLTIMS